MNRFRDIAAWILLVTFVAGGILGPSLHRVDHAIERAAEETCHSDAVHNAASPVWADDEPAVAARHCTLCVTRLVLVLPPIETLTSPTILGAPPVAARTHLTSVHVFTDRTIRGPPLRG